MIANWLAIDTATDVASVAVAVGDRTVARAARGARQHAAQILPLVQEVLALAQLPLAQLGGVVVGDGPGSFTGLRIGWAVAKGLIQERPVPLIVIPSMMAAAHAAGAGTVAVCYDALRGQVFGAMYAFGGDEVKTIVAPELFTIATLRGHTRRRPDLAVGDGAERYRDEVVAWTGRPPVGIAALSPLAASLLTLLAYGGTRRPIEDPRVVEPEYGRPAEAQVKWEKSHGRPLPNPPR